MPRKILAVDDEPDILELTRLMLEGAGIGVIATKDAQECFEKLEDERPDLILLDIVMPGMNGYDLCMRLKSDPRTKDIPVVLYTVLGGERERALAKDAGADGFMVKPMTPDEFAAFVEKIEVFFVTNHQQ